jgi:hypothetical protein
MIEGLIEKAAVLKAQIEALQEQYEATKRMLLQEMRERGLQDFRYAGYLVRVVRRHTFRPKDPRSVVPVALEEHVRSVFSCHHPDLNAFWNPTRNSWILWMILASEYITLRKVEE